MHIGFFDSGLGGLTILRAVRNEYPHYDYSYIGDTANLPYGEKTEEEIQQLAYASIKKLLERRSQLVIVACNTVSAESLRALQDGILKRDYPDRRVLGVIIPTIEELVATSAKQALLIATSRTVHSQKYNRELAKLNSSIILHSIATPSLVSKIESHDIESAFHDFQKYTESVIGETDTIILGCTHYTILKEKIRETYPNIQVLSQDEIIPAKIKNYLERHPEIESKLGKSNSITIELTKQTEHYIRIKKDFFGIA